MNFYGHMSKYNIFLNWCLWRQCNRDDQKWWKWCKVGILIRNAILCCSCFVIQAKNSNISKWMVPAKLPLILFPCVLCTRISFLSHLLSDGGGINNINLTKVKFFNLRHNFESISPYSLKLGHLDIRVMKYH